MNQKEENQKEQLQKISISFVLFIVSWLLTGFWLTSLVSVAVKIPFLKDWNKNLMFLPDLSGLWEGWLYVFVFIGALSGGIIGILIFHWNSFWGKNESIDSERLIPVKTIGWFLLDVHLVVMFVFPVMWLAYIFLSPSGISFLNALLSSFVVGSVIAAISLSWLLFMRHPKVNIMVAGFFIGFIVRCIELGTIAF